jgi:hypothetical protein
MIRVLHCFNHLLRFSLRVSLVSTLSVPVLHLRPVRRKIGISIAKLLDVKASIIRKLLELVGKDLAGQGLVVEILGPRQLRDTGLEAEFDSVANNVIGGTIPIVR